MCKQGRKDYGPPTGQSSRLQGLTEPPAGPPAALLVQQPPQTYEPSNIKEALIGPNQDKWRDAIVEEMRSLRKNHTWDLVRRPKDQDIVSCKWVFKIKSLGWHKARLVELVCRLWKSLYRLKQALCVWYKVMDTFFKLQGFEQSACNPAVYIKKSSGTSTLLLVVTVYVDDLLITGANITEIDQLKEALKQSFDMLKKEKIKLAYVASEANIADILTKSLDKARFEKLRELMGMKYIVNQYTD